MQFGINTVLWTYPFSSKDNVLLKKIKGLGYSTVELTIKNLGDKNIDAIREGLAANNLNCVICAIPGHTESILSPDENIQEKGIQFIKDLIDLCKRLGSSMLVGPIYSTGIYPEHSNPANKKKAWDRCIKNLKNIGQYAFDKGVKIAVEPLNRYESSFLNIAEDSVKLIEEVGNKNIGILLDVYHMNIEEKNLKHSIVKTGNHLLHMHVPEHDRGTPGTGHTDWKSIAEALKTISFSGCLVVESLNPGIGYELAAGGNIWRKYDYNQQETATISLRFLKDNFSMA